MGLAIALGLFINLGNQIYQGELPIATHITLLYQGIAESMTYNFRKKMGQASRSGSKTQNGRVPMFENERLVKKPAPFFLGSIS